MDKVTVSIITTTFHREDLLRRCVESILCQETSVRFEHIVVNDSGIPLMSADWMQDHRVRVLDTNHVERSVARNTGAALSCGDWLYFLDDDDYALPGALNAMGAAANSARAVLAYGGYQIHDTTAQTISTIVPDVEGDVFPLLLAGESFPTHVTWVRRDVFFAVGGFDPHMVYAEDVDLFRRVSHVGAVSRTGQIVAVARVEHPATTTTDPTLRRIKWHESAEKCLAYEETLAHVLASTRCSPYWRGRCAREYLASALRNLRARHYCRVLSRFIAAAWLSLWFLVMPAFWRGLMRCRTMMPTLMLCLLGTTGINFDASGMDIPFCAPVLNNGVFPSIEAIQ